MQYLDIFFIIVFALFSFRNLFWLIFTCGNMDAEKDRIQIVVKLLGLFFYCVCIFLKIRENINGKFVFMVFVPDAIQAIIDFKNEYETRKRE